MQDMNDDILLSVRHLEQHFKKGNFVVKAVDDVSFDIKKGEVLGLVGESGCGKTTTGRSIIKLYDITSGSIYFKGQRIGAGTGYFKRTVKHAKAEYLKKTAELKKQFKIDAEGQYDEKVKQLKSKLDSEIAVLSKELEKVIAEQSANIRAATDDHKNCNKKYADSLIEKTLKEMNPKREELKAKLNSLSESDGEDYLKAKEQLIDYEKQIKQAIKFDKKARIMHKMQMIFQDPIASLNPRMTVREIIAEGLIIRGFKDKELINKKVYEVLDVVGLVPEHASRYPHEFSGGQRQRIGIARSIILEPDLIIADEPVSALDVSIQAQVINLLNDLRKKLGLTILFIAHDLSVVKYFSDRIAVMYFGKIVELTSSDELFKNPLHPYTKSLLSAIPLPDPETEKVRQRIIYNPLIEHDYTSDKPQMREIKTGHFVYCNDAEFEKYKAQLKD